jgi:hypothetical protein
MKEGVSIATILLINSSEVYRVLSEMQNEIFEKNWLAKSPKKFIH